MTKSSGVVEHKHHILAGNEPIANRTLRSSSIDDTRYLHKDHLGSVDPVTNEAGEVVLRLSYDAFGKRRDWMTWSGTPSAGDWASIAAITHRGYTFHEELDNVDLIHMNGRVYDPNIGRFISADPFVQAPLMSQSLNRYSYVMNNPLSLIDRSGYSWLSKKWKRLKRAGKKGWDALRRSVNFIVGAALVLIGTYTGNASMVSAGWKIMAAPVQVGIANGRPYVSVRYGYSYDSRDSGADTYIGCGSVACRLAFIGNSVRGRFSVAFQSRMVSASNFLF